MPDNTTAKTRLFSWLRQGLNAGLTAAGSSAADGHLAVPIRLRVNDAQEINVPVKLYGPGDVTGLDPREIIRTDPPPSHTPNGKTIAAMIEPSDT